MEEKAIVISILKAKKRTNDSYKQYIEMKNNKIMDIDYYSKMNLCYETFLRELYNYINAIIISNEKKSLFGKIDRLKEILNEKIEFKNKNGEKTIYTFKDLFATYRNYNEHPEKTNQIDRYILFIKNIDFEKSEILLKICNELIEEELKKISPTEMFILILNNTEIKAKIIQFIDQFITINELIKGKDLLLYEKTKEMINLIKENMIESPNLDNIKQICYKFIDYLKDSYYKQRFISVFGEELYDDILSFSLDENITEEKLKKKIPMIFEKIYLLDNK